jgi:hypothetical protein
VEEKRSEFRDRQPDSGTMTGNELLPVVLWLAIEDYSGLWEVVWELNTRLPRRTNSNVETARQVVRELLRRGWIDLYWSQEPYGDPIRIPAEEAEEVLNNDRNWQAPSAGMRSVRIGASETEEEVYDDLAKEGSP